MAGMENENYNTGGMGAAIFGDRGNATSNLAMGDDYVAPQGLPDWKRPSFDEDDRVDPSAFPDSAPPAGMWGKLQLIKDELKIAKAFYFCFFGAFGSLFPLMAVYFKALGMDAAQCGLLIGIRPIIEYIATPIWHKISDRFQAGKYLLLFAVASWIIFTLPVGFIHPPVVSCKFKNGSQYYLKEPKFMFAEREKRSLPVVDIIPPFFEETLDIDEDSGMSYPTRERRSIEQEARWAPGETIGTSPQVIYFKDEVKNADKGHRVWVSPTFSNEVFEKSGVHKVFFLLLLLVIIGEFFSSPAIALADSAVITSLGDQQDLYGKQRMFGSIGWGVTMFVMGIVLDYSDVFPNAKCDPMNPGERNYNVCFYMFSLMMFLALVVATQFQFRYSAVRQQDIQLGNVQQNGTKKDPKAKEKTKEEKLKEQAAKVKVFASTLRSMPEFSAVFRAFSNIRLLMFMLVAWVMGIGIGLIFTFLFWHLQDYGGHPTLFGIASVINHVSEMAAYFYSFKVISKYGHVKVLLAGLLCNVLRFIYISFITWPWLVLPFEFVQGITHAAVWAACCSFISHNTPEELRSSAQGVLQGVHHGFGRFCGAVFAGMLIKDYGTVMIFRVYGLICAVIFILFFLVNFYNFSEGGLRKDLPEELDPKAMMEEGGFLNPHGVPGSKFTSSRRGSLENATTDYDAAAAVPQADPDVNNQQQMNNPFLADMKYGATGAAVQGGQDQYYGGGHSQAQSGYSGSGLGY